MGVNGTPSRMRSAGLVSVPMCGGGPVRSFDPPPIPPPPGFGRLPTSSEGNKALSSLSCYVSLPTNVSATVGQWLILVHLAKCLQDVCLGCLFPPPCPPLAPPRVSGRQWRAHASPPPSSSVSLPLFSEAGSSSSWRHKALPDLTMIFFSDHSHFLTPTPHATPPSLAVCWVYAGGVWWEKAWPSMKELQHFTVRGGWLAYHSIHWEEIHHYSRQGFPSSESAFNHQTLPPPTPSASALPLKPIPELLV